MSHPKGGPRQVYGAVLCAGFGTRLRPFTHSLPKPLFPFLNTPILAYALDHLGRAGAQRVACNSHHLSERISHFVDAFSKTVGPSCQVVHEPTIRGTGGGIRGIWDALGRPDGTLVVLNGDSILDVDLVHCLEQHWAGGASVSLLVRPRNLSHPGGVWLHPDGSVATLRNYHSSSVPAERAEAAQYDFLGVHFIDSVVLESLDCWEGDIIDELYGPMLQQGQRIGGISHAGFWAALDNPALVLEAQASVLASPMLFPQAPLPPPVSDGLYCYHPSGIADRSEFGAPVLLGAEVEVGAGARIGPSVVADRVCFAPGTVVRNCLLYDMGTVEGEWVDCIAMGGEVKQLPASA